MKLSAYLLIVSVLELSSVSGISLDKHQKHDHDKKVEGKNVSNLFKRSGTCQFPTDKGLVAVQKNGKNAGWAMHSDQTCSYGSWCPYACPPGQLMGQWNPDATTYTYPQSQDGGFWCNEDGELEEKNTGNSRCYSGKGTVIAKNSCGSDVAFCQTVLPGNEEMLIPTNVQSNGKSTLAVPGTEYWAGTAAHYYINPPGVSTNDACVWGTNAKPQGNWSPYVAGANQDDNGNTFVKIGWNPIYLEQATPFRNEKPSFGVRITCDDKSKCNGLPCEINPAENDVNEVTGASSDGAGGASFCVVTASNGAKANIEVFEVSGTKDKRHAHAHHKRGNEYVKTTTVVSTVTVSV
jgi:hypothetical protein